MRVARNHLSQQCQHSGRKPAVLLILTAALTGWKGRPSKTLKKGRGHVLTQQIYAGNDLFSSIHVRLHACVILPS